MKRYICILLSSAIFLSCTTTGRNRDIANSSSLVTQLENQVRNNCHVIIERFVELLEQPNITVDHFIHTLFVEEDGVKPIDFFDNEACKASIYTLVSLHCLENKKLPICDLFSEVASNFYGAIEYKKTSNQANFWNNTSIISGGSLTLSAIFAKKLSQVYPLFIIGSTLYYLGSLRRSSMREEYSSFSSELKTELENQNLNPKSIEYIMNYIDK